MNPVIIAALVVGAATVGAAVSAEASGRNWWRSAMGIPRSSQMTVTGNWKANWSMKSTVRPSAPDSASCSSSVSTAASTDAASAFVHSASVV